MVYILMANNCDMNYDKGFYNIVFLPQIFKRMLIGTGMLATYE